MKTSANSLMPWFRSYINSFTFDFRPKSEKSSRQKSSPFKHRILIIDTEWNILKLLYSLLKHNYDPVVKNCPFEALKWIQEGNHASVIICEYKLPHFHGGTFVQSIKGSGLYHKTPFIVLSGAEGFEQKLKNMPFTVDGIIRKPFDPTHLKITIQKVLNEYEPRFHH